MTQTIQKPAYDDEAARTRAHKRADELRGFYVHLIMYLSVNAGLAVLDAALGDGWWFYWVAIAWGIGVVAHAASVFAGEHFGTDWEQRKVDKYLRDEQARRR